MCFSGEMSAFFALSSIAMAAVIYGRHKNMKYCIGILYFGLMELLQAVQYLYVAVPEDGYSLCKNPTNQFLTVLGLLHICFQPFFCNLVHFSLLRRNGLQDRFESDIILRLCVLAGIWLFSRYLVAIYWPENPNMFGPATEACPNYEWMGEGYEAAIGWTTPNVPGHSCTFQSNTKTAHLAWVVPMYQATYFVPGAAVHSLLMFGPTLVTKKRIAGALGGIITGPIFAMYLTKSVTEQPAVWCFFSMFQCLLLSIAVWFKPRNPLPEAKIVHKGGIGEKKLEYVYAPAPVENGVKLHSD